MNNFFTSFAFAKIHVQAIHILNIRKQTNITIAKLYIDPCTHQLYIAIPVNIATFLKEKHYNAK